MKTVLSKKQFKQYDKIIADTGARRGGEIGLAESRDRRDARAGG